MTRKIFLLFLILALASCQKSNKNDILKSSKWLLGQWENKTDNGKLLEIWKKVNDSLYIGESFYIKRKDTLHFEKMQLSQKGEKLFYISTIKGQNNDKSITFSHNIEAQKQLVFENPNKVYPRKIVYQRFSKAHLLIEISGIQNGKRSSTRYTLTKTD
jgi:hypothetical protein